MSERKAPTLDEWRERIMLGDTEAYKRMGERADRDFLRALGFEVPEPQEQANASSPAA